jgi:acyl-coenzyme A thioesterase PaaI-like protein
MHALHFPENSTHFKPLDHEMCVVGLLSDSTKSMDFRGRTLKKAFVTHKEVPMPLSDFSSHDPDFTEEQVNQCARIIGAVRALNTKVVRLSGSVQDLAAAADHIEALSASLDAVTGTRAMETFRYKFDARAPNSVMPFNPATGAFNPVAPRLEMTLEGKKLVAEVAFASHYESAPDTVQGGMVAALYDQLLAFVVMAHGKTGPTVWLKVSYLKRTPINQPLRFEAWVESLDGENFCTRGSCYHGDVQVSEAEGLVLGNYEIPLAGGSAK